jgi:predicted nucleotidyltransferase
MGVGVTVNIHSAPARAAIGQFSARRTTDDYLHAILELMIAPVSTKDEIIERLASRRDPIRRAGVRRLGVFGSFVRGSSHDKSDVDLLVEFEPARKNFDAYWSLSELLEETLQRPVDLLTTESLSPYIGPRILAEVEYVPLGE